MLHMGNTSNAIQQIIYTYSTRPSTYPVIASPQGETANDQPALEFNTPNWRPCPTPGVPG
jgi:hypothetical protein